MQPPSQDPMNPTGQSSSYSQSEQPSISFPPDLPNTRYYVGGTQGKLDVPSVPPKTGNGWKIVSLVLFILVLILATATTTLVLVRPKASTPQPTATIVPETQQPTSAANGTTPTATASTAALVPSGTITENLLLTCGANCNDPIRVTITTIQVNDADGNMTWNISLKNVSGNSLNYGVGDAYAGDAFELLANGTQNQIPAKFAQSTGPLPNSDPVIIQGIFAFVPTQNTTYTLTVAITAAGQAQITFDPVQITNL